MSTIRPADSSDPSSETPPEPRSRGTPRFRMTRIAILVVLIGLWVAAVADLPRWLYRPVTIPGSPRPDISIVRLEPRIGIVTPRDALVSPRRIVWDRTARPDRLVLFTARGPAGEPAVRLATEDPARPGEFRTLGYAVRGDDTVWRWLEGEAAEALEAEERRNRPTPPPEGGPTLRQG